MPSPYSTTRADLCKHPRYRIGCWSCHVDDTSRDLAEAVTQRNQREHIMQGSEAFLAQSDMSHDEHERYEVKLKKAKEQHAAWNKRLQGLREMLAYAEEQVKHICSTTEPSGLADKFESAAVKREMELEHIWRARAPTPEAGKFVQTQPENPKRDVPFEGLDRTSIPATPDSLVGAGIGFEVFIRQGRMMDHRQPAQALGRQTGPAIMSYGSALAMFGTPDGPDNYGRRESEWRDERSVDESMKKCAVVAKKPEPRTEHDYRLQHGGQTPAEPKLSTNEQWALFRDDKFMKDAGLLASQYAKLVAERTTASITVPKSLTDSEGWPPVGELDWAGFTEWVDGCRKADEKFQEVTLPLWNLQREQRRINLTRRLKAWNPPQDFDDGSSTDPDPRSFFNLNVSLAKLEMERMGLNPTSRVVKKNPNPPAGE